MTTTAVQQRRWLDVDTVAGITGYARKTLYQMAREGRIPAVRVGRSVRWDRRELDRWMESRPRANT